MSLGTAMSSLVSQIGSELKLSLSSGHGSEAAEAAHCYWGCGVLGERHGDDCTGLECGEPLPGLRILDVEHYGAQQLFRGDVEGSGCRYSGRAEEMCSPQLHPRIPCSLSKRTEQGLAPWPPAGLTHSPVSVLTTFQPP